MSRAAITSDDLERCLERFPYNRERQCQLDAGHSGRCEHDDGRGIGASWMRSGRIWGGHYGAPLV